MLVLLYFQIGVILLQKLVAGLNHQNYMVGHQIDALELAHLLSVIPSLNQQH